MYRPNSYHEPDYPAALGILSHLNTEELKELLNNETKLESMVKDISQLKNLETEKEMIMASNRSLAEFNLAKEPQLLEGKQRLIELSEKGTSLCRTVDKQMGELKQHSGNLSLDTTLALLQTAAAESEEESDVIAEKFLGGELEIDEFLDQFHVRRKIMHLRRVKAEKMSDIVNRRLPTPVSPPRAQTSAYFSPPMTSSTPYPVTPVGMPMPGMYNQNML